MHFRAIAITNFNSFGPMQKILLAKQGLVAIFGENKEVGVTDSNGAGKSTVIEALVWCLWGETLRKTNSADDVINKTVGQDCVVTVQFADEGTDYQVTRTRGNTLAKKANDLILHVNGANKTLGTNTDTQESINNIVGMDCNTFKQAVLLGGDKSFCLMTDGEQKAVLEDILQLSSFYKAKEETAGRIKEAKRELDKLSSEKKLIKETSREFSVQLHKLKAQDAQYATLQAQRRQTLLERHTELEEECKKLGGRSSPTELKEELGRLDEAIGEQKDSLSKQTAQKFKISSEGAKVINKHQQNIAVLNNEIKHIQEAIHSVNKLVGTSCPTCKQLVDPNGAEISLTEWDNKYKSLLELKSKLADQITNQQSAIDSDVEAFEDAITETNRELKNLQAKRVVTSDSLRKRELDVQRLQQLVEQRAHAYQEMLRIDEEVNPFQVIIEETQAKLAELQQREFGITNKQKKQELQLRYLYFWEVAFSNKGIKSYILDNIIPYLTERAQHYADILSGGYLKISFNTQTQNSKGEWVDKFQVIAQNLQGADTYAQNSTGERRRVDLAVGWALGDLAAMRAKKAIRLKLIDEATEGLDSSGIDAVLKLLHAVSEEYETVFCISHSTELRDQFPKTMTIVKENGFSKVKQIETQTNNNRRQNVK